MEYIAFDSHKKYTQVRREGEDGSNVMECRIEHSRGAIRDFLKQAKPGTPVAVETIGNWYWIVDEIEEAGCKPRLVHARKAKLMMATVNKTDKLDAKGLNVLQRTGTLPEVWIPTATLRDRRELPRTRMVLVRMRSSLKNRIHATLSKYGLQEEGVTDLFGVRGRAKIQEAMGLLPTETRFVLEELLNQLDQICAGVVRLEKRVEGVFAETEELKRIRTLPGVGPVLSTVIWLEVGDVTRFLSAEHLASYAGTTPRVHSSGGKTRYGALRSDVNRYLKWAFIEAANGVALNARHHPCRHTVQLYKRIKKSKGHAKAIGAVARHLAEATFWMLTRQEEYKDPTLKPAVPVRP